MHAVILSGGVGSRLWPISRDSHPKPFIKLANGYSVLQNTFLRVLTAPHLESITNITNQEFSFKIKKELAEVDTHDKIPSHDILEPFGKNTAAAIALACLHLTKSYGKDTILLILPSDHVVLHHDKFNQAIQSASELAQQNFIVTFGIKPQSPETGYGYIEADGHQVIRFTEKPSLENAQIYLDSGRFYWNSGMFCFKASVMLEEMQHYCEDILSACQICFDISRCNQQNDLLVDANTFSNVRDDSIDYAIMEKSQKIAIIPCDIGWSDIGTWNALSQLSQPDAEGNITSGDVILDRVTNSHIESTHRVIGAIGIDNLTIVDTPDALLVANKKYCQDVKNIYTRLKQQDHEAHKSHVTTYRPWGTYTILENGKGFKIKRIEVNPGASLSLQMHHHRAEHWVVVSGVAKVVNGDNEVILNKSESTFIPTGHKHRLSNPGEELLVIIEVQTGNYLGEDDIVRFDDIYGRVGNS